MITIKLMDSSNNCVASTSAQGNDEWLCGHNELSHMGEVDRYSYYFVVSEEVPQLLRELCEIKKDLTTPEAIAHLDEIAALARQLEAAQTGNLMFTPFG